MYETMVIINIILAIHDKNKSAISVAIIQFWDVKFLHFKF